MNKLVLSLWVLYSLSSVALADDASPAIGRSVDDNQLDEKTLAISNDIRMQLLDSNSGVNNSFDSENLPDELETWEAPEILQKKFPFYHSGYDYEDRPIWVAEIGKFDIRSVLQGTSEINQELLDKWMQKMMYEARKSRNVKGVDELVFILDFDGFGLRQFSHAPTVVYLITLSRRLAGVAQKRVGQTIILNANYITRVTVDLMRPIFGRVYDNLEVFGTNKASWIPEMRRRFPIESIPPWYGGNKDYKPVKTFG